jgi:hypothetical protein
MVQMVFMRCDIIDCELEAVYRLSALGRPVSESERQLRSPDVHVGLLERIGVVDLEPASPPLANGAVTHVPPQALRLRPLQKLRRGVLEAVGMADEERPDETSAGKSFSRHCTGGLCG